VLHSSYRLLFVSRIARIAFCFNCLYWMSSRTETTITSLAIFNSSTGNDKLLAYANRNTSLNFKHIHDVCLVRALEASVCADTGSYYF
jgi:hypothetical protein